MLGGTCDDGGLRRLPIESPRGEPGQHVCSRQGAHLAEPLSLPLPAISVVYLAAQNGLHGTEDMGSEGKLGDPAQ